MSARYEDAPDAALARNIDRADRADSVLTAYARLNGCDRRDEWYMRDLMTDLMHYAARRCEYDDDGETFAEALAGATANFKAECAEAIADTCLDCGRDHAGGRLGLPEFCIDDCSGNDPAVQAAGLLSGPALVEAVRETAALNAPIEIDVQPSAARVES